MFHVVRLLLVFFVCFAAREAGATEATSTTDAQMARFALVAGQLDLAASNLASTKAMRQEVKAYAARASRELNALLAGASGPLAFAHQSDLSEALSTEARERHRVLGRLSGAEFDKAYAENELIYHAVIIGVMETTMIPSARDQSVRLLLERVLKVMKNRFQAAQLLPGQLK